jgi:serine phosphatase RsbU (regulator of sigma subunit)
MSSDGIFENIIDETQLQDYIESIKNLPPQKIVYELLNYTINNKIKTKDDMSIIALKIEKIA